MKKITLLILLLVSYSHSNAQDLVGSWKGSLQVSGMELPLIFHVSQNDDGYISTMDSPKQGVTGVPTTSTTFVNNEVRFEIKNAGILYQGKLEGDLIQGTFNQSGQVFPMNLSRTEKETSLVRRPQEPLPPFMYITENVNFENKSAGITLSGTLSLPKAEGPFPTVILISGSGPQDRDSNILGHKPFLVIADYLTKNGFAVLRYDDRGFGESSGNYATASIEDFASDTQSALEYLQSRPEVNTDQIGLIGHSEGGLIAPMVGAKNKSVDFMILLAGPGLDGDALMLSQKAQIEKLMGFNDEAITQSQKPLKEAYEIITQTDLNPLQLRDSINSFYKNQYGVLIPENQRKAIVNQITSAEVASLIRSKPSVYLSQLSCPVLALNGEKDAQVLAQMNIEAIENALEKGGNSAVQTQIFPNLNHLFQECQTGLPNEYGEIEQTFSTEVLETIILWLNGIVQK